MRHIFLLILSLVAFGASAYDFERLDSAFEARYPSGEPGAAIIVAKGDSILYERYGGLARLDRPEAIDSLTRFCIASCSKQFTVAALLQQIDRTGLPLLEMPVGQFFDYPQDFWKEISLRNLANHTSGVPDSRPRGDRHFTLYANEEQSIEYFPTVDSLSFGPGEYYDYLNPSFILLSKVVEQTSKQDFYDYARKELFGRAGMAHTYYFNPAKEGERESHGYEPGKEGWTEYDYGEETFYATRPDGGIYSTARDLLRWENALRDGKIMSPAMLNAAYQPSVSVADSPFCDYQRRADTWYGLGWFVDHPRGKAKKVYHTGDNGGYQAYIAKYPAEDVKIIVLENRHDHDRWQLATLIDNILGLR